MCQISGSVGITLATDYAEPAARNFWQMPIRRFMPLKMQVGPSICSFPNYSSRRFKLRVFVVETWGIRFGVIGPPKCLPIVIGHDLLLV